MTDIDHDKMKKYVEHWCSIDNEIKTHNLKLADLYTKRNILETKIKRYSDDSKTAKAIITDSGSKVKFYNTDLYKPLSLKHLKHVINEYSKSSIDKEGLYKHIVKHREIYNKLIIRRLNK